MSQEKEKVYLVRTILYNIQSHKKTIFEWHKGFNVVVGPSDSGKTAFQRGLNWNLYNESGSDLIRDRDDGAVDKNGNIKKENLAYVTNEYSNGVIVTRKYDKGVNIYEVIDENGELHAFDGFRDNVPELVSKLSGISPLTINEKFKLNLNIVPSRGIGIIDYTGGEKSQVIGAYAQANVIDVAIKNVQAEMGRINIKVSSLEKEIKDFDKKIEDMGDMDEKEKTIQEIDNLYLSLSEEDFMRSELLELEKSINEKINFIKDDKGFIESCKNIDKQELDILKMEQTVNDIRFEIKDIIDKRNRLTNIKTRIVDRQNEIKDAAKILEETKDIDKKENQLLKIEIEVNTLQKEVNFTNETRKNLESLNKSINYHKDIIIQDKKILEQYKNLDKNEEELNNITFEVDEYKFMIIEEKNTKNKLLKLKESINTKLDNRKQGNEFLNKNKQAIEILISECISLVKDLGRCPLCMSNLDKNHLDNIRKELEEM
ncbi:AAA family ATPase [Alkaliphilus sp. B6464]|uniref:AAA family ATPase n=1 Tax=Alkaliphilus sp. B6464 TaxID=2731219 RepID=UPI001BA91AB7|nr:AAA family ATPase [Alkaliphilus sp. B6464]QUH22063.1 AAA family ATPase [Alkaliphilus sp. B6464]